MPSFIALQAGEDDPVFAPDFNGSRSHRFAALDGLHKHIARAIDRFLDNQAHVGHQHQAGIFHAGRIEVLFSRVFAVIPFAVILALGPARFITLGFGFLGVVTAHAKQKNPTALTRAVFQILGEVDAFVMRLARAQLQGNGFFKAL